MNKNVISVIDGAAGSCGKAKVIGELATDSSIKLGASVTNCMPNAGHTFVDIKGKKRVFRNIPVSTVNPNTELFIGPGSAIDMEVFTNEYDSVKDLIGDRKIYVHEMVPLIEDRHKEYEKQHIKSGSTFKGCGAVGSDKVLRSKELQFFKDYRNAIVCSNDEWLERLYSHLDKTNEMVMLEGSQGCDLSLNHSGNYPYVTSRNVSTTQLLADSGIPAERLLETIMVIRPFPIRISNVTSNGKVIYTGPYGNGEELSWSHINLASFIGIYPYKGILDEYSNSNFEEKELIRNLIENASVETLQQVFGDNYKYYIDNIEEINLVQACELDRLANKLSGIKEYTPLFLEVPLYDIKSTKKPIRIPDLSEQTTVTKKERRVFEMDIQKLINNCRLNNPYGLYLNFFQHLDSRYTHQAGTYNDYYFNRYLREYINWLEVETNTDILALGTGEKNKERILKKDMIKRN